MSTALEIPHIQYHRDGVGQSLYNVNPALLFCAVHRTHKGEGLDFERHRYLKAIYKDDSDYIVIMKSTQCGISEFLVVRVMSATAEGRSVFYVLPTFLLASRFVRNRVDTSVNNTTLYKRLARMTRDARGSESMFLKHIGNGAVAFVGSNTPSVFTEFPADELVIDELDECDQDNLAMAWERLSAAESKRQIKVGNPTVRTFGISREYSKTDQKEWHLICECGNEFAPDFFKHVVQKDEEGDYVVVDPQWSPGSEEDIRLICDKCGEPVNRFGPGRWIAKYPGRKRSGYHVSKLFSSATRLDELLERFEEGLSNPGKLERFYNGDLGLPYKSEGANITRELLSQAVSDYTQHTPAAGTLVGIDVGSLFHYVIAELHNGRLRVVRYGAVADEAELHTILRANHVKLGAMDARPERRATARVSKGFPGVFACWQSGNVKHDTVNEKRREITVDRTKQLDMVLEAFNTDAMELPKEALEDEEFIRQVTAAVRLYDEKSDSYKWDEGGEPDHYHHALAFLVTARQLAAMIRRG